MANRNRGQVSLVHGDKTLTLSFSVNALCNLEEQLGKDISEILAELDDKDKLSMRTLRVLCWCALEGSNPEMTLKEAGDIVSDIGMELIMAKLLEAIMLAFPAPEVKTEGVGPK